MTVPRTKNITVLVALLCIQPLFTLVIKGWSSGVLLLGGIACLIALIAYRKNVVITGNAAATQGWEYYAFLFANCFLFFSIALTDLIRGDLQLATLNSPARFLFAIPVFIFLRKTKNSPTPTLLLCTVSGLLITLADQIFFKSKNAWSLDRMSSYFADPLAFGYISIAFSMMALTALLSTSQRLNWRMTLTTFAVFSGLYMSVMTESRTGWLAIPLVVFFILYQTKRWFNLRSVLAVIAIMAASLIALYAVSEKVQSRIDVAVNDVKGYSLEGIAPETSIGLRITFLRIAMEMISQRPLVGYGDTQVVKPEVPAAVKSFASPFAIDFALHSGFHNEVVTNTVQYGLPAGLAALMLFLVPFTIYWKNLKNPEPGNQLSASIGIAFTLVYFISSLSTEVFGLKYTASLYGLTTAILCAAATRREE